MEGEMKEYNSDQSFEEVEDYFALGMAQTEAKKAQAEAKKADEENQKLKSELSESQKESTIDELTGFYNRRGLDQRLKEIDPNRHPCIFFYFDLDNFKKINDTFGHDAGDEILLSLVEFANLTFRPEDLKARLGGDEFLIIVENSEKIADLDKKISERMFSNLEKFNQERIAKRLPSLEFSLGISIADKNNPSAQEAIKRADNTMYENKKQKKSQ
ncbi:MAG: GGDEF domain-containing protein [Candidatus Shapirobacteria bacterium]|nr:GGDEF domain-containing protein [Candidatus Shapirobacteria bacterium]